MTPYILGEAANQITPDTAPIYDLYATVNHYGNVYLGHYTASIKSPVGDSAGVLMSAKLTGGIPINFTTRSMDLSTLHDWLFIPLP